MESVTRDIGDALQRIVTLGLGSQEDRGDILTPPRRAILDVVLSHGDAITVDHIAQATAIHVNTARHHLDVLEVAALVERSFERRIGRGRPRVLYAPSATVSSAYARLTQALAAAKDESEKPTIIRAAARQWLKDAPAVRVAANPDEAVSLTIDTMQRVGFEAHTDAVGDTVVVTKCPYANLIAAEPLICELHAELVSLVLHNSGQPVVLDGLDVGVRPGVCRARLSRPDTVPESVARPARGRP